MTMKKTLRLSCGWMSVCWEWSRLQHQDVVTSVAESGKGLIKNRDLAAAFEEYYVVLKLKLPWRK